MLPDQCRARARSFMLGMAAIVVFSDHGSLLGPMLVGMCGGLYSAHRRRGLAQVASSTARTSASSTLAAAVVFNALAPAGDASTRAAARSLALPAALVFAVVNLGFVTVVARDALDRQLPPTLADASGSVLASQIYPFALLGVFLGALYLDYGAVVVPLFVVPILVARQTFASYLALKESQEAAVRTLIGALEAKDPYTAGHAERVAGLRRVHRRRSSGCRRRGSSACASPR